MNRLALNPSIIGAWRVIIGLALIALAPEAMASSHDYVNRMRSGSSSYIFVSQAVEGEFGEYTVKNKGGEEEADEAAGAKGANWRGYGFRNSLGIELLKFTQFSVSHTFLNMRSQANSLENLRGSRFAGEAKLVFAAPIGNLEAGGGVTASRLDYQKDLDNADFYGSGIYYTLGINYFFSEKVSFFAQGKAYSENLVRNSGSTKFDNIKTDTNGVGIGFNLWI